MHCKLSKVCIMFQISTWRPSRTKATHSTKPWGWGAWDRCSAVSTPAGVPTASPGPPITETAALHRPIGFLSSLRPTTLRDFGLKRSKVRRVGGAPISYPQCVIHVLTWFCDSSAILLTVIVYKTMMNCKIKLKKLWKDTKLTKYRLLKKSVIKLDYRIISVHTIAWWNPLLYILSRNEINYS